MVIIRDEKRIARMRQIGQYVSLIGMLALFGGLILAFADVENLLGYQLVALAVGYMFSQVGMYLAHRYIRNPRPDQVLDDAVKKVAKNGRFYHYVVPGAPHVLLNPDGIVVFLPKYQGGKISVEGDKWKQTGIGMRRFFGQEGVGKPHREVELMVQAVASFINKHAPGVEEVPIGALIVFTSKGDNELDLKGSTLPAMHYTKVKGFLRQKQRKDSLPETDYQAIRQAFDDKVGHILESLVDEEDAV